MMYVVFLVVFKWSGMTKKDVDDLDKKDSGAMQRRSVSQLRCLLHVAKVFMDGASK